MKNVRIVNATDLRNNLFEILNWINFEKKEAVITKNNMPIARIIPEKNYSIATIDEVIKRTYGMFRNDKVYFPYEDPKIITKEKKANIPLK
ncbi:hypothetical protein A2968_05815 [Candidatus Gottesmanbacteria bacterium RIFCSPLOWO2_01_FULL_42_22]|uniref:Antitoxin n=1 Tax=Candidatus Gottesmanbacteria bacterium RIFCSPLOWO2_01_FULL_42_22 TaxID=1798391 RepID=A0A1F6BB50_9BACT|nr:MAG: hypothetical protein UV46_C0047G0013 [Candidatus Gottesmanbacteria bacterium GW2011_GWC2_42_8]OGG33992.1 MAG: hypothetical protein A2968_05815 [Candidatus Gottesmanbacteria bacterium RIFCSPLOWO2_01_FULL_42_22]OGG34451.1 MAG: hypothetical protein A3G68_04565 [Candidatus Gottesmanbacteria bacterium RIFCSPLOWO2_12_FULL_42_10]